MWRPPVITLALPALHLKLEDDIRSGGLEAHLLRPKGYLLQTIAQSLGGGLVRLAALGVTGGILLLVSGRTPPPLEAVVFLALLGPLALTVGVLLYTLAGLAAFWARRVLPVQLVIQKLMFLAGGLFAPISLYPEPWAAVVKATPFAAHLYWAGRQVLAPSWEAFAWGVGWSLFWIAALGALCEVIWRAGLGRVRRGEDQMLNLISSYAAGAGAAIRASFSDRANFALQVGGMIVNDVFFLALWVLFFAGFRQVGGWGGQDVLLLLGLAMVIVSVCGVFFGGFRDMAASILKGEPDALLTQPKPVLLCAC